LLKQWDENWKKRTKIIFPNFWIFIHFFNFLHLDWYLKIKIPLKL
jgi:hypothetical protein